MNCYVCGSTKVRCLGRVAPSTSAGWDSHNIIECRRCGVSFSDPLPSHGELADFYEPVEAYEHVYGAVEHEWRRRQHEKDLRRIEKQIGKPGRILDVGCSFGLLLEVATSRGWEGWGVEPNPRAAERAAGRVGKERVMVGALDDLPADWKGFDAVSMSHVFEHFVDPRAALRTSRRVLRPGGVLAIQTPNRRSFYVWRHGPDYRPVEHPFYWTPKALRMALCHVGLVVAKVPSVRPIGELRYGWAREAALLAEWVLAPANVGIKSTLELHAVKSAAQREA